MKHIVLASALNVRAEPTTSSSIQSVVARYAVLEEIGATEDGRWLKLVAPGHRGWCSSKYMLGLDAWRARLGGTIAGEFGVGELAGTASHPRIVEYQSTLPGTASGDEVAWCSSFIHWSVQKALGIAKPLKGITPAARSWKAWGSAELDQGSPTVGSIAVLWRRHPDADADRSAAQVAASGAFGHVAMLAAPYQQGDKLITLLGGNQGGRVSKAVYPLGSQYGLLSFRSV